MVAALTWGVRYWMEPDHPNSFILDSMFFAFAAQCIHTLEIQGQAKLLMIGFLLLIFQVLVVQNHRWTTLKHYRALLSECVLDPKNGPGVQVEVEFWANMLLRITGTDFFPALYWWLATFTEEPRERARETAVTFISNIQTKCLDAQLKTWTPELLTVGPSPRRTLLKWAYLVLWLVSWICFFFVIKQHAPR